jgi:hypothetical protein
MKRYLRSAHRRPLGAVAAAWPLMAAASAARPRMRGRATGPTTLARLAFLRGPGTRRTDPPPAGKLPQRATEATALPGKPPELVEFERLQKRWRRPATSPSCGRPKPTSAATWNSSPRWSPAPPTSPTSRSGSPGPRRTRSDAAGPPGQRQGAGGLRPASRWIAPSRSPPWAGPRAVLLLPLGLPVLPRLRADAGRPSRPATASRWWPISVDGGPMPGFPNARRDNGIAPPCKVTRCPPSFWPSPSPERSPRSASACCPNRSCWNASPSCPARRRGDAAIGHAQRVCLK